MNPNVVPPFTLPAVLLVGITSLLLLLIQDWRLNILALAFQYVGVFLLVIASWPIEMAAAKLVAGWMSGAILGMAAVGDPASHQSGVLQWQAIANFSQLFRLRLRSQIGFRLIAAILVILTVISVAPTLVNWMPAIQLQNVWGSLILIGMGMLSLGFSARPLPTTVGLLTVLAGFEVLYAALEASTLVAGLLAVVNLGLALAGAYLMTAPLMETEI